MNFTAKTFSFFESAMGLGSVISAVYLATLQSGKHLIKIIIVSTFIFGGSVLLLSLSNVFLLSLVFMSLIGMGMMAQSAAINTYIQMHAAPNMRARVISYYIMAFQGVMPIGSLLIGFLADISGPKTAVAVSGCLGIISIIVFLHYKKRIFDIRGNVEITLS